MTTMKGVFLSNAEVEDLHDVGCLSRKMRALGEEATQVILESGGSTLMAT